MEPRPGRVGWLVPGAALATLLLVQLLRAWFPTVLFVVGDAGSTSAIVMGGFALGCLAVGPLIATLLARRAVSVLHIAGWVLAAAYLALPLTDGGAPQAAVTTFGVVAGTAAVTSLAGATATGATARAGVVLGLGAEVTIHAVLGTWTLAWQPGVLATLARAVLAVLLVVAVRGLARERERDPAVTPRTGAAWPWLVLAPLLLLVLIVAGAPGRVAVATGWSAPLVTAAVVGTQALAALAVLLAPRIPTSVAAVTGGGLALVGATGALQASGTTAALAQAALAVGLAIVAVTEPVVVRGAGPRRRAGVAAVGVFGFGVLTFVYYAAYDIPLGFYNRAVLLAGALLAAGLAAGVARRSSPLASGAIIDRRRLVRVVAGLVVVVVGSGLVRLAEPPPAPAPGADGDEIHLLLYNLHMGFDPEGRFAIERMAQVIIDEDPDIVVLNEVDRGWLTTGGQDLLHLLEAELDLHAVFAPGADEVWGNAILTRYPIAEFSSARLPRGDDPMPRGQFAAVLEVADGQQLGVVGTHLSHIDDQGATRLPQARAVAGTVAWFRERGLPTVVLGDLNAEPDSAEIETFGSFVGPTLRRGNPTFPSGDPQRQIDHILISADLRLLDARVLDSDASDHRPVAATVEVQRP